ncbi:MAG TPA: phosphatase PAP2 family protein [Chthoniobacterales bacterium]|nr:phosphatase PAP2 family protein [Chthoniobacterales bacterium]
MNDQWSCATTRQQTRHCKLQAVTIKIVILIVIALLMWGAFFIDTPVRSAILHWEGVGWDHSSAKTFVAAISRYGDWPELMLLGCVGFFIARVFYSRKWQRILIIAMIASTLAGTLTNTLRLTTGRTRPRVALPEKQGWYGLYHHGKCLVGCAEFNSFPSGHTATAVGFATVILLESSFWGILAMVLATAVASSRMLLGAHHPSDLLAAIILSVGVAWVCWNYFNQYCPKWLERLVR